MAHKLECLNRRDRYMIGDWVLRNGKPYRWTAKDYNRSQKGMEEIADMSLTKEILKGNEWTGDSWALKHREVPFRIDVSNGEFKIMCEYEVKFVQIHYVHQLQCTLRTCNLYNLAENFKIE